MTVFVFIALFSHIAKRKVKAARLALEQIEVPEIHPSGAADILRADHLVAKDPQQHG